MLDAILAEVDVTSLKPIRPFDLRQLGYRFHDTPKVVFKKPFELRMVLDEDTKREVDFSLFLNTEINMGLLVPHSFTHYSGNGASSTDGTPTNQPSATSITKG